MIAVEVLALIAGFSIMVVASQRAVGAATELAAGAQLSPFVIGFTILAIGTDLPEMANSIVASLSDHGDVNVGDSVGSAATQVTLVLGLLGVTMGPLKLPDGNLVRTGVATVGGLLVLAVLLSDGHLGRLDALMMLSIWAFGSFVIYRKAATHHQLSLPEPPAAPAPAVLQIVIALGGLALSASVALWGLLQIAERFDAPEFLVGFFLASLGTSLPELVFDVTAIRRGSVALAVGDVVGSSFVDATASVAIGPLLAPTDVTRDLVVRGTVLAAIALGFATLLLGRVKEHDWRSGIILLFIYSGFFVAML